MLRRLTQTTPRGEVEHFRWDDKSMTRSQYHMAESKWRSLIKAGYYAADRAARVLVPRFDPMIDTIMLPSISGGGYQTFVETLTCQSSAGSAFNTYTTAKTVINPTNLFTLPSNWFYVGRSFQITITGNISNIVTTPGLMNFQVKIGSVAAFDTGNIQLNATAHTTLPFWLDIICTCRAIGNSTNANLIGLAKAAGIMFTQTAGQTDSAQGMQVAIAPATAPAVGTGFDSTVANIVDFFVGFTISNGNNQIKIDQYIWRSLN